MSENHDRPRCSRTPLWITVIILILLLGLSVFMNLGLGAALLAYGSSFEEYEETAADEFPEFEEEWSYGDGETKVVRLALDGLIIRESEESLFYQPIDKIEQLIRSIRAAANDEAVAAIVLEVNSPGGGITESDELYHALRQFKASREDRKVIVFMKDIAASGGYYVAMAGDWLIAQPTAIIGSIGVIMQSLNWKTLSDKVGVSDVTIKSGANKDMLNPFRETDPAELALLQDMIDRMHARFKGIVADGRKLDETSVASLADGRIFTSDQAVDLNLIDQIGYWDDVAVKTRELLGNENLKFIRYYQPESFWDILYSIRSPLAAPLARATRPASFQYLWQP